MKRRERISRPARSGFSRCVPVAALMFLAAGCGRRVPPPDLSRDASALLGQVAAAQDRVRSARGTGKLRISSPTLSGTVSIFAAAEKPDRVHLEVLDFFGNVAAVMVADGKRFSLYDARTGTVYRGSPSPENVSRLLPIVLPPEELVTILCGSAPILDGKPISATPKEDRILLVLGQGEIGQRLTVGEAAAVEESRIRRVRGDPPVEDAPAYDLVLGTLRRRGSVRIPFEVALDSPAARTTLRLTWRDDLEINPELPARLFELTPPRGAKVVELAPGGVAPDIEIPVGE